MFFDCQGLIASSRLVWFINPGSCLFRHPQRRAKILDWPNLSDHLWEPFSLQDAIEKADVLIEALGWIRQFRDKVTVIKLGGSVRFGCNR